MAWLEGYSRKNFWQTHVVECKDDLWQLIKPPGAHRWGHWVLKNIKLWIIILFWWEIFFGIFHAVFLSVCCCFWHQKLRHTVLNYLIGGSVELICITGPLTVKATDYWVVGDVFITKWTYFLAIFPFWGELIYNSIFMSIMSHATHANNIPFLGVTVIWCWWHFPPPCFCPQVLRGSHPHRYERKMCKSC